MAWTQAMETSQGWWVDLSCFEYSCPRIRVVKDENFKVGGFEFNFISRGSFQLRFLK